MFHCDIPEISKPTVDNRNKLLLLYGKFVIKEQASCNKSLDRKTITPIQNHSAKPKT